MQNKTFQDLSIRDHLYIVTPEGVVARPIVGLWLDEFHPSRMRIQIVYPHPEKKGVMNVWTYEVPIDGESYRSIFTSLEFADRHYQANSDEYSTELPF